MAQLIIKRTKHWMHKKQSICIFCDEKYVDCVENDASKKIQLDEGTHTVWVKMSTYQSKSIQVELSNNQPTTVELSIPKWLVFGDITAAAIVAVYLIMKFFVGMEQHKYLPPLILAFAAAYMIYNILVVRKRYFKLKQI